MINKWFWLELHWAALVNASAEMIVAVLSALILVPPIIYALVLSEQLDDVSVGLIALSGKRIYLLNYHLSYMKLNAQKYVLPYFSN
jgi:hypothetical protein